MRFFFDGTPVGFLTTFSKASPLQSEMNNRDIKLCTMSHPWNKILKISLVQKSLVYAAGNRMHNRHYVVFHCSLCVCVCVCVRTPLSVTASGPLSSTAPTAIFMSFCQHTPAPAARLAAFDFSTCPHRLPPALISSTV